MQLQCVVPKENFRQLRHANKYVRGVTATGGQSLSLGMTQPAMLKTPCTLTVYDDGQETAPQRQAI